MQAKPSQLLYWALQQSFVHTGYLWLGLFGSEHGEPSAAQDCAAANRVRLPPHAVRGTIESREIVVT
jgi:hypothetical protein